MAWIKSHGNYYFPTPPGLGDTYFLRYNYADLHVGYWNEGGTELGGGTHHDLADAETWRFRYDPYHVAGGAGYPTGYYISQYLTWCLAIDGSVFFPNYSPVNNCLWWGSSIFGPYGGQIYLDDQAGDEYERLVLSLSGTVGGTPEEYQDADGNWCGDEFYTAARGVYLPGYEAKTFVMTPRGSLRDSGTPKTVSLVWPRWVCDNDTGYGRYSPVDGAEGYRYFGHQRFSSADGRHMFVRRAFRAGWSASAAYLSGWEYVEISGTLNRGPIHQHSFGIYDIGDRTTGDYYTGGQPSVETPVTFRHVANTGDAKPDIVLHFDGYVAYEETEAGYYAEVARWY